MEVIDITEIQKKSLFYKVFVTVGTLAILNGLAIFFYWYSTIWYFDMITHFLGGLSIGFGLMWFFYTIQQQNLFKFKQELQIFIVFTICIIGIGVGWEIYEYILKLNITPSGLNYLDTLSDICFDTAGAFVAFIASDYHHLYTESSK